ncbi:ras gtpase [Diplodia corticola]|uniref:Ras gtpase n=1 Tax=Diplodia corticola TaxID=236234 RepID=A0A1J9R762_9PEZI|nr:ras gtpase [Diplodia corticola]OJD36050.1 ras gtpase [Diplodia corticola]
MCQHKTSLDSYRGPAPPTRLIYCVDGTWCGPDGTRPSCNGTLTNIYQIYTSILDSTHNGELASDGYYQKPLYMPGIGSADDTFALKRFKAGLFGNGYLKQIKEIYEECCKLGPQDEVWLFGFSRGAFVVRAVAGLLHYVSAIRSAGTPQFAEDYERALEVFQTIQKEGKLGIGEIHRFLTVRCKQSPKIKFVGALDTVKAVKERCPFDISFNNSIEHMRHALALDEDREAMTPEYVFPETSNFKRLPGRTLVQAWFIGAHIDMGGSAARAGLALYPLQWLLIESRSLGLALKFRGNLGYKADIVNPLRLVFPALKGQSSGTNTWSCTLQNGLEVSMQDIRHVHEQKSWNLKLNKHHASLWPKKKRSVFGSDGNLNGWVHCDGQGTIIHPSVYLLIDVSGLASLNSWDLVLQGHIERWRPKTLVERGGKDPRFWDERNDEEPDDIGPIRVLVCGNTGIGKSTLINKVFGTSLAVTPARMRGDHDIRTEIKDPDQPNLILHDSEGFEAGALAQMDAVTDFLHEKSAEVEVANRFHVIWFCIDSTSDRTMQSSTEQLFKMVSKYACEVPIIVVATMKDRFLAIEAAQHRESLEEQGLPVSYDECDRHAKGQLEERISQIRKEMLEVPSGRLDACVAVSRKDQTSIEALTETTFQCISNERVRLIYVGAQVAMIDLKIKLAVSQAMTVYRRTLRALVLVSGVPSGPTTTRTAAILEVCKRIITCFGLPASTAELALQILRAHVWSALANNVAVGIAETFATLGLCATVATGGPFVLVPTAVNIPIVVPATARLLATLTVDLILILTRAFQEAADRNVGEPFKRDLQAAARAYRTLAPEVHREISGLLPRANVSAAFRSETIKIGLEQLIEEYKGRIVDDNSLRNVNTFIDVGEDEIRKLGSGFSPGNIHGNPRGWRRRLVNITRSRG